MDRGSVVKSITETSGELISGSEAFIDGLALVRVDPETAVVIGVAFGTVVACADRLIVALLTCFQPRHQEIAGPAALFRVVAFGAFEHPMPLVVKAGVRHPARSSIAKEHRLEDW